MEALFKLRIFWDGPVFWNFRLNGFPLHVMIIKKRAQKPINRLLRLWYATEFNKLPNTQGKGRQATGHSRSKSLTED